MNIETNPIRNDWEFEEVKEIYQLPLIELIYKAAKVHRQYHDPLSMKVSTLISLKTGSCEEDCVYCAQSARYNTKIEAHSFMSVDNAVTAAKKAKQLGSSRVCLSASWREVKNNEDFAQLKEMIRQIKQLDLDVCCTLGMITVENSEILKKEGISAYNHNLDTSENFYHNIITTRTYSDRLATIENLIDADMPFCSGGIIGMGESEEDRMSLLHVLSTRKKHPFSVPLNCLVPIEGTPLENMPISSSWEIIRMIATARILMPASLVCLAAGRTQMNDEAQALCYIAGANSIFIGEKLLTTPNPNTEKDFQLFNVLGLKNQKI